MKKLKCALLLLFCLCLTSCSNNTSQHNNEKPNIVCTVFPQYDFVREIAGDTVNITMLLKPGSEAHSFEPAPKDIMNVQSSELFIMIGGVSEVWAEKIADNITGNTTRVLKLIECVEVIKDEHSHNGKNHSQYDEHIWTSPKNAVIMAETICKELCSISPENAKLYKENCKSFTQKLNMLGDDFKKAIDEGKRNCVIFADRFPFRYLARDTGLKYFAAFPGCSSKTEPSAADIALLTDKIKAEQIPAVFCVDYANPEIAKSIQRETGVKILKMYSCHLVTKDEFENGEGYLSLMAKNLSALKEALN